MDKITLKANAKINLTLNITGRREDGYHLVSMLMQSVDFGDIVEIEKADGIFLSCGNKDVPDDERNVAFKAAKLFFETCKINGGARIKITKNIPVSAGLAGGSSDAATVLKGLNELYSAGKSERELMDIGVKIGADVPYCIMGKTALAEGIGEILTQVSSFDGVVVCLAKPNFPVSTPQAYKEIDNKESLGFADNNAVIKAIKEKNVKDVCKGFFNVFEEVISKSHPEIEEIKKTMLDCGALGALMSGSGPSVFGIFENEDDAEKAQSLLKNKMFCVVTKTV